METIIAHDAPNLSPGLLFDNNLRSELNDAAWWAKFISIMGFIFCGLMMLLGLFMIVVLNIIPIPYRYFSLPLGAFPIFIAITYILFGIVYLFPSAHLFRFATKVEAGIDLSNQSEINASIAWLKSFFRFVGILLIIGVCLYSVALFGILGVIILL
jgi:hypothetical protein